MAGDDPNRTVVNIEVLLSIVGTVCAIAAGVLVFVYTPICGYFTIKLSQRRRSDVPFTWRDFWGWNRANLLFFPDLLDDEGKQFQLKAINAAKKLAIALALGVSAVYLLGSVPT